MENVSCRISPSESLAGLCGSKSSKHIIHMQSDGGVKALHVDASPSICSQLFPSMLVRSILDCKVHAHNLISAYENQIE